MTAENALPSEKRVVQKYAKLYEALMELNIALQNLEPGGTVVNRAKFDRAPDGHVRVHYIAQPRQLIIEEEGKRFMLRVEEME